MLHRFGSQCIYKFSSQGRAITPKHFYALNNSGFHFRVYWQLHRRLKSTVSKIPVVYYRPQQNSSSYHSSTIPFQSTILQPKQKPKNVNYAYSFNTNGKYSFSTFVWLIGKPIAKILAIFIGRSIRKRFWALSPAERQKLLLYIQENYQIPGSIIGGLAFFACVYYLSHLEATPITQRTRFISFSHEDAVELAKFQADVIVELFKNKFVRIEDRRVKRTVNVAKRLIDANPDVTKTNSQVWKIYVIKDEIVNAFVLPTGQIFVFDGILQLSDTDDQLAIILGHEMAHAALNHAAEGLSIGSFADWFLIIGFGIIWSVIPSDILAILTTYAFDKLVDLVMYMPSSRRQEWEADHVGLIFAANACYDIREAGVLWRKIARQEEISGSAGSLPVWMGTHPDSLKRATFLDSLMADAEGWRKEHGCPPLPTDDPRKHPV